MIVYDEDQWLSWWFIIILHHFPNQQNCHNSGVDSPRFHTLVMLDQYFVSELTAFQCHAFP